jgi:hypothetical protein
MMALSGIEAAMQPVGRLSDPVVLPDPPQTPEIVPVTDPPVAPPILPPTPQTPEPPLADPPKPPVMDQSR